MKEYQYHFGRKFYQRQDGYWVCTTLPSLYAHRWVWIIRNGEIPPGKELHHKDEDPSNNAIENLQLLTCSEHLKLHWRMRKFNPDQLMLAI